MESVEDLLRAGTFINGIEPEQAIKNLIYALGKGRAEGHVQDGHLHRRLLPRRPGLRGRRPGRGLRGEVFNGTATKIGGVGIDVIAQEVAARHAKAYPTSGIAPAHRALEIGGEYQWRREGEPHLFDPETVFRLQHSTRTGRYDIFKKYTDRVNEQSERLMSAARPVRLQVRPAADPDRRGRAGERDRQAVLDGRDVVRLHLQGGARDPSPSP